MSTADLDVAKIVSSEIYKSSIENIGKLEVQIQNLLNYEKNFTIQIVFNTSLVQEIKPKNITIQKLKQESYNFDIEVFNNESIQHEMKIYLLNDNNEIVDVDTINFDLKKSDNNSTELPDNQNDTNVANLEHVVQSNNEMCASVCPESMRPICSVL